jgi:hypothetical protein
MSTPFRLLLVGVGAMMSGCSGNDSDPSRFAVRDSAGIPIVSNFIAGGWSVEEAPQLVEELRIGTIDGEESYQFGMIMSLDVDSDGNIYVLDFQSREVKAFDGNGQFLRRMGRPGSGPGELGISTSVFVQGDSVGVMDAGNRRVQWFSPDGVQAGSFSLPTLAMNLQNLPTNRQLVVQHRNMPGSTLQASLLMTSVLVRHDRSGEVLDTIFTLPSDETVRIVNGNTIVPLLLGATPIWGLAHGNLLTARSTEMRVEIRSADGTLARIFTLDSPPVPVSDEHRERLLTTMENAMGMLRNLPGISVGEVEINPHLPMISSLFEGPRGTIWVASPTVVDGIDPSGTIWQTFDAEGRFLGTLSLGDFQPMRAAGDRIYGIQADDLGVQYVVRMKIEGL